MRGEREVAAGGVPAGETLAVQVAGGRGAPERLLLIERPAGGRVRVREWTSADWSRPAEPHERDAAGLLAELRRADAERGLLGVELYRVARWLEQPGAPAR